MTSQFPSSRNDCGSLWSAVARRLALAVTLLLFVFANQAHASYTTTFHDANEAYKAGAFDEAAALYRALANDEKLTPELLVNLGNAEFRIGNEGASALAYRRALVLEPGHPEAKQNLRFLRRTIGFTSASDHAAAGFARSLSAGVWGLIIGLGLWAILLPSAAIFALPSIPRGSLHIVCALGIIAIITAGTALLIRNSVLKHASELAVTLPDSVTAHSAPTLGTPPIISLPAGSEIQVLSTRGDWVYAQISDDLRGWIPGESTAPLWPYDPALIP